MKVLHLTFSVGETDYFLETTPSHSGADILADAWVSAEGSEPPVMLRLTSYDVQRAAQRELEKHLDAEDEKARGRGRIAGDKE